MLDCMIFMAEYELFLDAGVVRDLIRNNLGSLYYKHLNQILIELL